MIIYIDQVLCDFVLRMICENKNGGIKARL